MVLTPLRLHGARRERKALMATGHLCRMRRLATLGREVELAENFAISGPAVKNHVRKMKSVIKLDKNFHIYVHGGEQLIEHEYDAERGMKCYKLYYREEK